MSLTTTRATAVRDGLLVGLTFGAGAVDAISFFGLGRVFTGNMTGNLVLLGLAAGSAKTSEVVRSAVSLGAFCVGVLLAVRVVATVSRRTPEGGRGSSVWPIGVSVVLGLVALVQAGFLAGWLTVGGHPGAAFEAVLVGLSALAMGMQSDAVAACGVAGVTSTYVTGTMTGLLRALVIGGDAGDRLRRAAVLAGLLVGAVVSAVLVVNGRRFAPLLPLAVTVSVLATAGWTFRGKPGRATEDLGERATR